MRIECARADADTRPARNVTVRNSLDTNLHVSPFTIALTYL